MSAQSRRRAWSLPPGNARSCRRSGCRRRRWRRDDRCAPRPHPGSAPSPAPAAATRRGRSPALGQGGRRDSRAHRDRYLESTLGGRRPCARAAGSPRYPRWRRVARAELHAASGPVTSLRQRLEQGDIVILDGAMGTELQRRGVPMDGIAWSGVALATHPETVLAVHEDYVRAGAEILITNSFASSRHVLAAAGLGDRAEERTRRAVALARSAIDRARPVHPVWVAGSISSFVPAGDQGRRPSPEAERASYREQSELLAEAGVDLLALEMV